MVISYSQCICIGEHENEDISYCKGFSTAPKKNETHSPLKKGFNSPHEKHGHSFTNGIQVESWNTQGGPRAHL